MPNTNEIIEFINNSIDNVNLKNTDPAGTKDFHEVIHKLINDVGIIDNIDNIIVATSKADIASCVAGICDNIKDNLEAADVSTSGITLMTTVIAGILSATLNKFCVA